MAHTVSFLVLFISLFSEAAKRVSAAAAAKRVDAKKIHADIADRASDRIGIGLLSTSVAAHITKSFKSFSVFGVGGIHSAGVFKMILRIVISAVSYENAGS